LTSTLCSSTSITLLHTQLIHIHTFPSSSTHLPFFNSQFNLARLPFTLRLLILFCALFTPTTLPTSHKYNKASFHLSLLDREEEHSTRTNAFSSFSVRA
jgi:hypothetical protein